MERAAKNYPVQCLPHKQDLAGPRRIVPIKIPVLQGESHQKEFWLQHMSIYLYLARD